MMRQNYSKAIEDRLNCIRSGSHPAPTANKRKISRIIFLIDVILIIVIFFYFHNTQDTRDVTSGSVTQKGIEYQFSCTQHDNEYIMTASIAGKKNARTVQFDGYIADIVIYYGQTPLIRDTVGKKKESVAVEVDAVSHYFLKIPHARIDRALKETGIDARESSDAIYSLIFKDKMKLGVSLIFRNAEKVRIDTKIPYTIQ